MFQMYRQSRIVHFTFCTKWFDLVLMNGFLLQNLCLSKFFIVGMRMLSKDFYN